MFQPGVLYHALYRFFYKAPTIIRKDIPFITSQLQSLQNLDISLPIITLFAPRLMTESIPRTHFRVQFWRKLLAYEAKGASMQDVWQLLGVADAEKNIQEYLLDADSKPLVELALLSPLSKLFRLVFIRNRANPKDSSIWKRDLREILDANTEQFFTSFLLKDEIHDEKMTKKTAQEYIKFMQESIAKLKQHFPFISLANTELDQRLPPDGPSMDIVRSYEGHFTECLNNAKMEDRVGLDSFLNAMLMPKAHK